MTDKNTKPQESGSVEYEELLKRLREKRMPITDEEIDISERFRKPY